jgi:hypothetical protein
MHFPKAIRLVAVSTIILAAAILTPSDSCQAQIKARVSPWDKVNPNDFDKNSHTILVPRHFEFTNALDKPKVFAAPHFQQQSREPQKSWSKSWRYVGNRFYSAYYAIELYRDRKTAAKEFNVWRTMQAKGRGFYEDPVIKSQFEIWSNADNSLQHPVQHVYDYPSQSHISHTLLVGPFVARLTVRANRMHPKPEMDVIWRLADRLWDKLAGERDTLVLFARKDPDYLPGIYHICLPKDPATGRIAPGIRISGLTYSGYRSAKKFVPGAEIFISSVSSTIKQSTTSGSNGQFSLRYGTPPGGLAPRQVGIRLYTNKNKSLMDMKVTLLTQAKYNLDRFSGSLAENLTQRGYGAAAHGPVSRSRRSTPGPFPFDGRNHLHMDASLLSCPSEAFSIGATVYPTTANESVIASNAIPATRGGGFDLSIRDRRLLLQLIDARGNTLAVGTQSRLGQGPQHLMATYDGSRVPTGVRLYVNGKQATTTVLSNKLAGSTRVAAPILIGNRPDRRAPFIGKMGNVAFFRGALSPQEAAWFVSTQPSINTSGAPVVAVGKRPTGGGTTGGGTTGVTTGGTTSGGTTGPIRVTAGGPGKMKPRATILDIASTTGPQGGVVTAPVTVYNVDRLGDADVRIYYPVTILKLIDFTQAAYPAGTVCDVYTDRPGEIRIGWANPRGVTGSFVLGELKFRLVARSGISASVSAQVTGATQVGSEARMRLTSSNGIVKIQGGQTAGNWKSDGKITRHDVLAAMMMSVGKLKTDLVLDLDKDYRVTAKDARLLMGKIAAGRVGGGTTGGGTTGGGHTGGGHTGGGHTGGGHVGGGLGIGNGRVIDDAWSFEPVYTANINGLKTSYSDHPAWSADGGQVFFSAVNLWGLDLATKKARELITAAPDPLLNIKKMNTYSSRLMVAGQRIVYYTALGRGKAPNGRTVFYNVFMSLPFTGGKPTPFLIQNQNTGRLWDIRSNPAEALYQELYENRLFTAPGLPPNMAGKKPYHKLPKSNQWLHAFSPDWKRVAVATHSNNGPPWETEIYAMPEKLLAKIPKTRNLHFVRFSPDGSHLVASQIDKKGSARIVIIPLAAPDKEYVVFDKAIEYSPPAWSPDGKHIAFAARYADGVHMGRNTYSRKFHVVRLLGRRAAGNLKALDIQIAEAKREYDAALQHLNSLDGNRDHVKSRIATKRFNTARKNYNALLKQREQLRAGSTGTGRPTVTTGGPTVTVVEPVKPVGPPPDYSAALGKPVGDFQTFSTYMYRSVLHRDPSGEELLHCLKVLKVGKARHQETLALFRSPNYLARKTTNKEFIRDAYQSLLGREPSLPESKLLELQMRIGASRSGVLQLITTTGEHQDIVRKTTPPARR